MKNPSVYFNKMIGQVTLYLLLLSLPWSHQKMFLVKTNTSDYDEAGDDYKNTSPVPHNTGFKDFLCSKMVQCKKVPKYIIINTS